MTDLLPTTIKYIQTTIVTKRKKHGQYFTPNSLRSRMISDLKELISEKDECAILEPGCGTGEFINDLLDFPNVDITGIELDKNLIKILKKVTKGSENVEIINDDFLEYDFGLKRFDCIIGNPPFFQIKLTKSQKREYKNVISGRANVFALFIYRSINLLRSKGIVLFVLPRSILTSVYFQKLRHYIIETTEILNIISFDKSTIFDGAYQDVIILNLQKLNSDEVNSGRFVSGTKEGLTIFTENYIELNRILEKAETLHSLDLNVSTGTVVWNDNRSSLTNKSKKATLLIYSHNIKSDSIQLDLSQNEKKQYIKGVLEPMIGPAIVMNRVIGGKKAANIKCLFVPSGTEFMAENHTNVIQMKRETEAEETQGEAEATEAKATAEAEVLLKKLRDYFVSEKAKDYLRMISSNTQISKKELLYLFPIEIEI